MNTQSPCKGHDNDDEDEDGVLRTMSLVQNKNQRWKGRREIKGKEKNGRENEAKMDDIINERQTEKVKRKVSSKIAEKGKR